MAVCCLLFYRFSVGLPTRSFPVHLEMIYDDDTSRCHRQTLCNFFYCKYSINYYEISASCPVPFFFSTNRTYRIFSVPFCLFVYFFVLVFFLVRILLFFCSFSCSVYNSLQKRFQFFKFIFRMQNFLEKFKLI